jgi:nicotinate-nucleotide adenylyltransferase
VKFAVLGGSFDPVHTGHIKIAGAAVAAGYDRIIFVPVFRSPFKGAEQEDSARERLNMLLAAISARREFTLDPCEITREGVSYTIDTLRDIAGRYPFENKLGLLLGDDLAAGFPQWKDAEEIASFADIVVAHREQAEIDFPFRHITLKNDIFELSSAEVRALIAADGAWQTLVPDGAREIIAGKGLYKESREQRAESREGGGSPPRSEPVGFSATPPAGAVPRNAPLRETACGGSVTLKDVEDMVRGALNVRRFLHSRNVALHCADLAGRFGMDADRAYLAGITHDVCKDLADDEMVALAKKDGQPFSGLETQKPSLLHGRAAAIFLNERLGIDDPELLEAVRLHTTGAPGMGPLAKIVYLTDKIEVGRYTVDQKLRELAFGPDALQNLDELFSIIHKATIEFLEQHGLTAVKW